MLESATKQCKVKMREPSAIPSNAQFVLVGEGTVSAFPLLFFGASLAELEERV